MFKKLKKWIAYNPPYALTWEEWREFDKEFKKNAPVRFFIKNIILVRIKQIKRRYIDDSINWVRYRTTRRFHIINTGLKPGYYDKDHIMLHGNFSILKNYVEVECAAMHNWDKPVKEANDGVKHLEWEISLGEESPRQSESAKEILTLYKWWTEIRPNRERVKLPIKAEEALSKRKWTDTFFDTMERVEKDDEYKNYIKESHEQTDAWNQEDDDMLIRLIKIRKNLWT